MRLLRLLLACVAGAALGLAPATASAQDATAAPASPDEVVAAHVECAGGTCRVTDAEPADASAGTDGEGVSTAEGEPGRIVCPFGATECRVEDASVPLTELAAGSDRRLVHGAVEADPTGTWRFVNLPTRVRCTVAGADTNSQRVRRTRGRGTIEQDADGTLIAQSDRAGEAPYRLVPMGPGIYGSVQQVKADGVDSTIISYYGFVSEDRIEGTAHITTILDDGGGRTECVMKRDFDMVRLSGAEEAGDTSPQPETSSLPVASD